MLPWSRPVRHSPDTTGRCTGPAETVYFRSLTLERFSLKPADIDLELHSNPPRQDGQPVHDSTPGSGPLKLSGQAQLKDKDGQTCSAGPARRSAASGPALPAAASRRGGEYTLVYRQRNRFPEKRKFLVNRYQLRGVTRTWISRANPTAPATW